MYSTRKEKQSWVYRYFQSAFEQASSVLDVGCDTKDFQAQLATGVAYLGLDMADTADIQCNLDTIQTLPVSDQKFDMVIALDVLEHIEQIHLIADELFRVSERYVLISLPNPVSQVWRYILNKPESVQNEKKGAYLKYYGIPLEKPDDRHRWFFSYEEALSFVTYKGKKRGFRLLQTITAFDQYPVWKKAILTLFSLGSVQQARNIWGGTSFFLLEKHR